MNITIPKYDMNFIETITIGTGTSLALDFTTNKLQEQSTSTNQTMTVTGLAVGETGKCLIYNSHATNIVTITNPTASNFVLQRGLTTVSLLAGEYVEVEITRYTNFYKITYGEAMVKNA